MTTTAGNLGMARGNMDNVQAPTLRGKLIHVGERFIGFDKTMEELVTLRKTAGEQKLQALQESSRGASGDGCATNAAAGGRCAIAGQEASRGPGGAQLVRDGGMTVCEGTRERGAAIAASRVAGVRSRRQ